MVGYMLVMLMIEYWLEIGVPILWLLSLLLMMRLLS
jgi:hypothetical protein